MDEIIVKIIRNDTPYICELLDYLKDETPYYCEDIYGMKVFQDVEKDDFEKLKISEYREHKRYLTEKFDFSKINEIAYKRLIFHIRVAEDPRTRNLTVDERTKILKSLSERWDERTKYDKEIGGLTHDNDLFLRGADTTKREYKDKIVSVIDEILFSIEPTLQNNRLNDSDIRLVIKQSFNKHRIRYGNGKLRLLKGDEYDSVFEEVCKECEEALNRDYVTQSEIAISDEAMNNYYHDDFEKIERFFDLVMPEIDFVSILENIDILKRVYSNDNDIGDKEITYPNTQHPINPKIEHAGNGKVRLRQALKSEKVTLYKLRNITRSSLADELLEKYEYLDLTKKTILKYLGLMLKGNSLKI